MNTGNENENLVPDEQEKDLISFEDVNAAISGDEDAIIEQLERAKQVAVEQIQQRQQASEEEKIKMQEELAKKEAELEAAKERAKAKIASTKYKDEPAPPPVQQTPQPEQPQPVEQTTTVNDSPKEEPEEPKKEKPKKEKQKKVKKKKEKPPKPVKQKEEKPPKEKKVKQPEQPKPVKKKKILVRKKVVKKPSNAKYYILIIFFIALFAFVYFLPEISKYMAEQEALRNSQSEVITTGNLECKKETNDDNLDYSYNYIFAFDNSKLTKLRIKNTTTGSLKEDQDELEKINNQCELLKSQIGDLKGVEISCSFDAYSVTVDQELRYIDIKVKKVSNGYIEAGGTYPNYKYKQNINKIEKDMKAAGYKCERTN